MQARDIMSRPVVRVEPETPVREAIVLLLQYGFAALPVVNANEQVVGISPKRTRCVAGPGFDSGCFSS